MSEINAVVERLNSSGYEYKGGPVTAQNAAAVVDILLQQLDDAAELGAAPRKRAEPIFYVSDKAAKRLLRGYTRFATMTTEPKAGVSLPLYIAPPPAPVVPEGWKLVPIEPTQEMIDAHVEGVQSGGIQKGYRAMLAAAPEETLKICDRAGS